MQGGTTHVSPNLSALIIFAISEPCHLQTFVIDRCDDSGFQYRRAAAAPPSPLLQRCSSRLQRQVIWGSHDIQSLHLPRRRPQPLRCCRHDQIRARSSNRGLAWLGVLVYAPSRASICTRSRFSLGCFCLMLLPPSPPLPLLISSLLCLHEPRPQEWSACTCSCSAPVCRVAHRHCVCRLGHTERTMHGSIKAN